MSLTVVIRSCSGYGFGYGGGSMNFWMGNLSGVRHVQPVGSLFRIWLGRPGCYL